MIQFAFAQQVMDATNDKNDKLTYTIQRRFSNKSTLDVNDFYFYLGDKELTFAEFKNLTKDPLLDKTDKVIKNVMVVGGVCGGIFGLTLIASVIPAGILVNNAVAYTPVADKYLFSGIAMFAVAGCSVVGIMIDIIVAVTLYNKYRYNENIIRQVVDNYNKKLKKSVLPDVSFNDKEIGLSIRVKI